MGDNPTSAAEAASALEPEGHPPSGPPETVAASLPAGEPPSAGPLPRGSLSAAQADAVARMVVQGRPINTISMAVGRSPESLRRMIAGSLRPRIEQIRAEVMRETSAHWFEMLAMLPQARLNMQTALMSQDEKVRVDMSKWIHEAIVPRPAQHQEVEHTVHLGDEVSGLLEAMNARLAAITSANAGRDPLARVKTGPEALPRAVTILPSPGGDGDAA